MKITELANGTPCQARIPGICNFDAKTCVWCHLNDLAIGRGESSRPPDEMGFVGCSNCHDAYDGRRFGLTKEVKRGIGYEAMARTYAYFLRHQMIQVLILISKPSFQRRVT